MKRDPETYEMFPPGEESWVLSFGLYGALLGVVAFGFSCGVFLGALDWWSRGIPNTLLIAPPLGVIFAIVFYLVFGSIFYLIGFIISHVSGHTIDLRVLAVLTACSTVYVPFALPAFAGRSVLGSRILERPPVEVLWFAVPLFLAMSFVASGAWIGADRRFQEFLAEHKRLSRRFELKNLFGATFVLALLLFLSGVTKLSIVFWIGFVVLMVPVSLVTVVVVWSQRFWPQRFRARTVRESASDRI